MKIINSIVNVEKFVDFSKKNLKSIGFVPTMGALHEGHLSLIRKAKAENNIVVCSIFVNPIQFNNQDDLKKYPRNIEKDITLLEAENCDILFNPSIEEMYPPDFNEESFCFKGLDVVMEGKLRPGHFKGVATVVKKLFDIIKPTKAYFGEKDYQQLLIINKLVETKKLNILIEPCSISREDDGLARSSRNLRLTASERAAAPFIYKTLLNAKNYFGSHSVIETENYVKESFINDKILKLEYFSIANAHTLEPITDKDKEKAIGFIAVYAGEIRLIDNIKLNF